MAYTEAFNVDTFKSKLLGGGARANQFVVNLNFPQGAGQAGIAASFLVNAASLPGSVVNPTIVPYRGREVKLAGERVFAPWTVTILNDAAFTIRNQLEYWMNLMNNTVNNSGATNPTQYQTNLTVTQLDRNNAALKAYTLVGAFPVDLSDIALNYGDNDTIETFTCTFQYQHFTTGYNSLVANVAI